MLGWVAQSRPTLCNPMDCGPPGSTVHEGSPGQNTGVGCPAILQEIFSTQELNPGLPHCRHILYQLSYQGSPQALKSDGGWQARPQALVLYQTPRWFQCGIRSANQVDRGGLREPVGSCSNTNSRPRDCTDHLTVGSFSPHVSPA